MGVANQSLSSASGELAGTNQGIKDQANEGVNQSREMQSMALGGATGKEPPAEDPAATGNAVGTAGADARTRVT